MLGELQDTSGLDKLSNNVNLKQAWVYVESGMQ